MLLDSHETFRRYTPHLLERLGDISVLAELTMKRRARLLGKLGALFADWMSAMRSHERYEEHRLYPLLVEHFGVDLGHLENHHRALHERAALVDRAVASAQAMALQPGATPGWPALEEALREHGQALEAHLLSEENAVIPLVLELPASHFARLA